MKNIIHLFWSYIYFYFKASAFFKLNFILKNLTNIVYQLLSVLFLFIVFKYIPTANGWSYYECLFLQSIANLVIVNFYIFFSGYTNFASKYLYSKRYDIILMRPLHSLLQILFENISLERIPNAALALIIMAYAYIHLDMNINIFLIIPILILYSILSLTILGCICILLTSISFSIKMRVNLFVPLMNLFEFARYPFVLYGKFIAYFFSFILPLAYAAYFPAGLLLKKITNPIIFVLPVLYILILVPITTKIWRHQELKYMGVSV